MSRRTRALGADRCEPRAGACRAGGGPAGDDRIGRSVLPAGGQRRLRRRTTTTSRCPTTRRSDQLDGVAKISPGARDAGSVQLQPGLPAAQRAAASTVDGTRATFTRDGQELRITPPRASATASTVPRRASATGACRRRSSARRSCSGRRTGSCTRTTASSSAPSRTRRRRGSRSNDHPGDKATWTFRVTVPDGHPR